MLIYYNAVWFDLHSNYFSINTKISFQMIRPNDQIRAAIVRLILRTCILEILVTTCLFLEQEIRSTSLKSERSTDRERRNLLRPRACSTWRRPPKNLTTWKNSSWIWPAYWSVKPSKTRWTTTSLRLCLEKARTSIT